MSREGQLDSLAALVSSVRRLMAASAHTDLDAARIDEVRDQVDRAAESLEAQQRDHGIRRHLDREAIARAQGGDPWTVFTHNPLGIPLQIRVLGDTATARVEPSALLEGPPRLLHGGFSAAMMDALLSTLVQVRGLRAVTVRLDVSFVQAVPLDRPLDLRGEITAVEGRKIRAVGHIDREGQAAVRAEALLIEIPGEPD